ncbi:MAG: hypothetical protein AAGH87_05325 [Pseudomonadota bacterium]
MAGKDEGGEIGPGPRPGPYADDIPVTFRPRAPRRGWVSGWIKAALVVAGIAAGLIALVALGPGIAFAEYWLLVAAAFGALAVLLIWEAIAFRFSKPRGRP